MLGHAKNSYFKNFFVILYKIKLVAYHAGRMYTNRWQNMNAMFAQITFQWCLWHTLVMNLQGKGIKTCHIDEKKRTILLLYHKCNSFFPTYMINIQRLIKHCTQFDYYIHWYIYSLRKLKLKSCSLRSLFSPLFFWGGGGGGSAVHRKYRRPELSRSSAYFACRTRSLFLSGSSSSCCEILSDFGKRIKTSLYQRTVAVGENWY